MRIGAHEKLVGAMCACRGSGGVWGAQEGCEKRNAHDDRVAIRSRLRKETE